nr:collagen alpha-1(I) chain-like [Misgurnus anguillicaudatus]
MDLGHGAGMDQGCEVGSDLGTPRPPPLCPLPPSCVRVLPPPKKKLGKASADQGGAGGTLDPPTGTCREGESYESGEPDDSGESGKLDDSGESGELDDSGEPGESGNSGEPGGSGKPGDSGGSGKPVDSGGSGKPDDSLLMGGAPDNPDKCRKHRVNETYLSSSKSHRTGYNLT